jgi:cation diffusion facilitator CzcD-associated flavoprotein CzcO
LEHTHFDVLIVGAGLSGIGAACHLQMHCPGRSYVILEGRETLGGTWDLFRYPGIRSDSDVHTLGYSFRPWTSPKAIADGPAILAYVRETAEAFGVDRRILYRHRVERACWSSEHARWTVEARNTATGERVKFTCGFLFACAGYYDYDQGYTPAFPGRERFAGRVVHPQQWSDDVEYEGKRVVVIGSGATAVTLVPELARRAAHVTMLQRSPTYVVAAPARDRVADWMREHLPLESAHALTRWKNVLLTMALYQYCRRFPASARRLIVGQARRALGAKSDLARHFTPTYNPWDQRLCLAPDGDLFEALREGRASVVTDRIATFTERGILLESGQELPADLIVTATGLQLKFMGGVELEVDGRRIDPPSLVTYKGVMFSGVPNLAIAIGYTNASWTLKCDLSSQYVCKLLNHMDAHGYAWCCPRRTGQDGNETPILDLTSGYVRRSIDRFPKQGSSDPWRARQNYLRDLTLLKFAPVDDEAMEFHPARSS